MNTANAKINTHFENVINGLIEKIEGEEIEYINPWKSKNKIENGHYRNFETQREYTGGNFVFLWLCDIFERKYSRNEFLTFKQIEKLGGSLKKGAKGIPICFYTEKEPEPQEDGTICLNDLETKRICKYYFVFNIEETKGIIQEEQEEEIKEEEQEETEEKYLSAWETVINYIEREKILLEFKNNRGAYFSQSENKIVLPTKKDFLSKECFYSVLFHELTHSAEKEAAYSTKAERATEEFIAEIGSFLCLNKFDIESELTKEKTIAYLQNWKTALKETCIMSIAKRAGARVDKITG